MTDDWTAPDADLDITVPHSARIWNYWLGGKDNFEVDRAAGDAWAAIDPQITVIAREARAFLQRVVHFLAGEAGIRQFLDVGTGLPTADNTHEVAQRVAPNAHIVYVDNDPLVLAHARALLVSRPEGSTQYIHADMRDTDKVLEKAAAFLDFTKPVAILFMGVLGHIADLDEARTLVRTFLARVPSGSYLAIGDSGQTGWRQKAQESYAHTGAVPYLTRRPEEIESFFDGLEWVEPGLVSRPLWRPDRPTDSDKLKVIHADAVPSASYGGVARKP